MVRKRGKQICRRVVVVAELGAAVGMLERDSVAGRRKTAAEVVDAADGRDHPDVVADADLSVGAAVAHERAGVGGFLHRLELRFVRVLQQIAEIGCDVVRVHVVALGDVARGMSDGHAVLDYVLAVLEVAQGVLVSVLADLHVVVGMDDHAVTFSSWS